MLHFVVSLGFTADASQLLLTRKNRPVEMMGMLNGNGGSVEEGETAEQAVVREFKEECLIDIPVEAWKRIAMLKDAKKQIDIFSCFDDRVLQAKQGTDEALLLVAVDDPRIMTEGVPNLGLLVRRALHRNTDNILVLPPSFKTFTKPGLVCR